MTRGPRTGQDRGRRTAHVANRITLARSVTEPKPCRSLSADPARINGVALLGPGVPRERNGRAQGSASTVLLRCARVSVGVGGGGRTGADLIMRMRDPTVSGCCARRADDGHNRQSASHSQGEERPRSKRMVSDGPCGRCGRRVLRNQLERLKHARSPGGRKPRTIGPCSRAPGQPRRQAIRRHPVRALVAATHRHASAVI